MSEELPIESVTGGAGGTTARYDDLLRLARLYDATGDALSAHAWDDKALAADGDLLASAVLAPGTFAEAEGAILAATVGPRGLAARALGLEADALVITVSVEAYRVADATVQQAFEALDYLTGYAAGAALPALALVGGVGVLALAASNPALTAYLATHPEARQALLDGGDEALQGLLEDNPALLQHLVNGGGGLVDGLMSNVPPGARALLHLLGVDPVHPTTNDAAAELAELFVDGDPRLATPEPGDEAELAVPRTLEDLIQGVARTNLESDGVIHVQVLETADGPRWIVNLPGTDDWVGDPGDARDLGSNLRLVGGDGTVYSRGIVDAMAAAGVPRGADVMLVGHSQGGMTAVQLAADAGFREQYDVRHVVTAGSPTAQVPHVPGDTRVLSLENTGDVVPLLDGEDNPDHPHRTTVRFDGRTGSVGGNHDLLVYAEGAAAADASDDPSLREQLDRMRRDGFLADGEGTVETSTQTFKIVRDVP